MTLTPELQAQLEFARTQLIAAGNFLARRQYHVALAGNISARVGEDLFLCTCRTTDKEILAPDDFVLCDLRGRKVAGAGDPTSEAGMHAAAYATRPDAQAVIHSHPPIATAFAAASVRLDDLQLPEMMVLLGPVGFVPYANPGTRALAEKLAQAVTGGDAFLLENHGALTLGRTVRQAALRMDLLEEYARVSLARRQLGKPFALAPADRDTLLGLRERVADWGCTPFGDET
jgi:L-fuculose-phosphate aldolase